MTVGAATRALLGACWLTACAGSPERGAAVEPSLECVAGEAPEGSPARELAWMIGAWVSREDGAETIERWCAGEGGALVGDNRTIEGGRVVHSEVLRVEARGGALVYVASPSGQAMAEFSGGAECGDDTAGNCSRTCEAVFSNPAHDFPQEITYGRCLQNEFLVATIRGGERRASWTFERRER